MRFAAMEFFDWSDRAKSLARRPGSSLRLDAE